MSGEKVEGWSNYPTWSVNLWLANDRKLNEKARALVVGVGVDADPDTHRGNVARAFKVWIEGDLVPDLGATIPAQLLSYALGEVNWYELAQEWINNVAEEVTE